MGIVMTDSNFNKIVDQIDKVRKIKALLIDITYVLLGP